MGFSMGIIGLPNVGKSTLFNAITGHKVEAANYPFCTIEPNRATIPLNDDRLDKLAEIFSPKKITPATLEIIDIAGLVKNAHRGEGLGNKFLSHIREVDALIHVVRCFENENIVHIDPSLDPRRDIEIVETELLLRDMESVENALEKAKTKAKSGKREDAAVVSFFEALRDWIGRGKTAHTFVKDNINEEEIRAKKGLFLLTDKPAIALANVENSREESLAENPHYKSLNEFCAAKNIPLIAIAAGIEAEIAELPPEERGDFYKEMGIGSSALDSLLRAGYETLDLITYFTGNRNELAARTLKKGSDALTAAGKIHTDFARGFIRADVISAEDLIGCGSLSQAREKGLVRGEGREYKVAEGDVVQFVFNV